MTSVDLNSGALAPVATEINVNDLQVMGTIPADLTGQLVRIGPNPFAGRFEGEGVLGWWTEAAMLHALTFSNGQAQHYSNRWLKTAAWATAMNVPGPHEFVDTNPNVNVITHAGSTIALGEGVVPLEIDQSLNTLGMPRHHVGFSAGLTGHPKLDPVTNELIGFKQDWMPPFLRYVVFDKSGREIYTQDVEMDSPSMMHDMAITRSHSIFFDLGVSIDFEMLQQGNPIPIRWFDERPCRLGVLPREGGQVRWFGIESCFIQHAVNAYEENDTIVLDVIRYPWYFKYEDATTGYKPNPLANLWRYVIDLEKGYVSARPLGTNNLELPRINDSRTGRMYRYFYAVEQPSDIEMRGIAKYDLVSQTFTSHCVPPGDQNSEPIFVPRDGGVNEDDGWVVVCVYRKSTDTSDVLILNAKNIEEEPVAVVQLPARIPAGFHGGWIAG